MAKCDISGTRFVCEAILRARDILANNQNMSPSEYIDLLADMAKCHLDLSGYIFLQYEAAFKENNTKEMFLIKKCYPEVAFAFIDKVFRYLLIDCFTFAEMTDQLFRIDYRKFIQSSNNC